MGNYKDSDGVTIGDITGGIHGSIIAGRDVRDVTITLGGKATPAAREPTAADLRQLLSEVQEDLAAITALQDELKQVSPAAPLVAQGAEQSLKAVAAEVQDTASIDKVHAESMQERLGEAASLLGGILDRVKTLAEKADQTIETIRPLAEKLGPVVEKLAVAALWVARLWL